MVLAGHAVTAGFDKKSAAWLQERQAARELQGYAAHSKDCVVDAAQTDAGVHTPWAAPGGGWGVRGRDQAAAGAVV